MTTEEKAEAYDKVFARAKRMFSEKELNYLFPELKESEYNGKPNGGIVLEDFNGGEGFYKVFLDYLNKEQVEEIEGIVEKWNSELKKSEDEKLREQVAYAINQLHVCECTKTKLLTWLEKQDDANKEYWRGYREGKQEILDKYDALEKKVEQKPVEEYNITCIGSKHAQGKLAEMIKNLNPVNEILEQNPACSEEDKEMINNIIDYMIPMPIFFESTNGKSGKEYTQEFVKNAIKWLKSLKERIGNFDDGYKVGFSAAKHNQWKPSDEQMERLNGVINSLPHQEVLYSLYQDLKKLKE